VTERLGGKTWRRGDYETVGGERGRPGDEVTMRLWEGEMMRSE